MYQQATAVAAAASGILITALQQRWAEVKNIHRDTPVRAKYRAMFDAAAQLPANVELEVQFVKNDDTVRQMRCRPIDPADYRDPTARYVTVFDLEKEDFRRVALDSILEIRLAAEVAPL